MPDTPNSPPTDGQSSANADAGVEIVGVEDTSIQSPAPGEPRPTLVATKIEEVREAKRGQIAMLLVWLLVGLAASAVLLVATRRCLGLTIADVKEIVTILFPSVVALVGTVIGFYFGSRSGRT